MGLAVAPDGTPTKRRKAAVDAIAGKGGPQMKASKAPRKGWTLFILKQNATREPQNLAVEPAIIKTLANYQLWQQSRGREHQEHSSQCPPLPTGNNDCYMAGDGSFADEKPTKERIRGLTAIVQDVLSRSRSGLCREYNNTRKSQEDCSIAELVGFETIPGSNGLARPESSVSFRMRLIDRCDTDLDVIGSLSNGRRHRPASLIGCEPSQSCRYSLQLPREGSSIVDLLERGKPLGIEDNSRILTAKFSTTDEYACVVERLRDGRGTIRLLAATAVREATRNSTQAREDLWNAGAIPPLVNLLQENDMGICYMATMALLNLAIGSVRNKQQMADCGCVPILVRLMRPEATTSVRESATTVILSLAASDQLKPGIGASGAIIYLSDILSNGTTQGRSDAVRALLNLSIFKGNRSIIAQAGVISPLYKVILRDSKETAEKAVILLSHLFQDREGKEMITAEEHSCSVLLQILIRGTFSRTCKEQTVVILLALSAKVGVRREAVFAQGILPCLVEMALIGSNSKIQEKATKLLRIIKEHRLDRGILSMDRVLVGDIDDQISLQHQNSSSTVDSCITTPPLSRRRVTRSVSSLSGKEVQLTPSDSNVVRSFNYFRTLCARNFRSEYLTCRAVSINESSRIPVKFMGSFCSQS